jgi:hypothetical protein
MREIHAPCGGTRVAPYLQATLATPCCHHGVSSRQARADIGAFMIVCALLTALLVVL